MNLLHKQNQENELEIKENQTPNDIIITWNEQQPAELLTQVGEWLETYGKIADAHTYYDAAISVDSSFSLAAWRSGQLAISQHDYLRAAEKFEYMLRIMPDHAPAQYLTSLAYSELKDFERALFFADNALRYNPKHDGAYLQKLRSLHKLGRWLDMSSVCESLPNSTKQVGEAHLWCAIAAVHTGDVQAGRVEYEKIPLKVKKQFSTEIALIERLLG